MDIPTLSMFLRPILTVTTVWNTGETGDIYFHPPACRPFAFAKTKTRRGWKIWFNFQALAFRLQSILQATNYKGINPARQYKYLWCNLKFIQVSLTIKKNI